MRIILSFSESDIVVGGTRAQQITAVIVQGVEHRRCVAIVQSIRVARAVILSAQRGPSQRMDIVVAVIADDAGCARRGRRFGANRTLLALNKAHVCNEHGFRIWTLFEHLSSFISLGVE
jgi:hypothetical protein